MAEPIKFEFINNSLTNQTQHAVIQKVGSYFKIPQKMLRAALDEEALTNNIVRFPQLANIFDEEFYPVTYKIKLADLMIESKFVKSNLYSLYLARPEDSDIFTIVSGSDVWVLNFINGMKEGGGGGIYLDFKVLEAPMLMQPMHNFLAIRHPSPLPD